MDNKDFDTFDFLINDEDEVMLLLYQREGKPLNPHIELDAEENPPYYIATTMTISS